MKKFLIRLFMLLATLIGLMYIFDYDYLLRAVRVTYLTGHKTAFLEDYTYFDNREIEAGDPQPWAKSSKYNQQEISARLAVTHKTLQTTAFVVIHQDSIVHESYYDIGAADSQTNSFSMAKSMVTSALGKAIDLGFIKSLDSKVIEFLPELQGEFAAEVSVGDLASMASGLRWDEHYYGPTSLTTQAYFKKDLRKLMLSLPIEKAPGKKFVYQSGDTQLLAMVLEKATQMNLSKFVSTYFWQPMGMENPAIWQIDHEGDGIEKAYCCVVSNAKDFARWGKLYLQNGEWNGQKILPRDFVQKSIEPRFDESPQYGYGWWLENYKNQKVYYMRGHLGQFVIVLPETSTIIVRLGHLKGLQTEENPHSEDLYVYIDEALNIINP